MKPRVRTWTLLLIAAIGFMAALFWIRANPTKEKNPLTEAQETIEQAFGMKLALESGPQGGLPVEAVEAGGPAANVGVEVGDRILAVGDESVWHVYQLIEIVNRWVSASPGLPLLVEREGEYRVLVFRSSGPLPLPGEEDGHQH
ncbi:MAG TPA: PDZ domain-containing protein [Armatimonadota bacterium]|nr:PDZ domain-containing protein [Armatimonadota bacterium]